MDEKSVFSTYGVSAGAASVARTRVVDDTTGFRSEWSTILSRIQDAEILDGSGLSDIRIAPSRAGD